MYRELSIWKRIDGERAAHFRCFEDLASHLFCVQSADYYALPVTVTARREFDRQFVELFIEVEPKKRSRWFATIEEAIAAHEEEFSSMGRSIAEHEKKR
ncbi:hypothetical protein I6F14_32480 [Bradyrhizobium sp. IC3069]|uniref:hypothetical protein n=1 Tax=unclassified Bradyrhizobium TaxID=2631580 RepID=UPI001CD5084D|nr:MULTISPECIES: hypothetical protein [unclassified Bradyrhizobium]MCA1364993.1 hypothetical protein [Bradyrhizobium sp. IC4059]MCA1522657.1 hypothetical protein [Bradyrhizobium sp. IC3069]